MDMAGERAAINPPRDWDLGFLVIGSEEAKQRSIDACYTRITPGRGLLQLLRETPHEVLQTKGLG